MHIAIKNVNQEKKFCTSTIGKQAICKLFLIVAVLWFSLGKATAQQRLLTDYVNPFIGTANYGATHPGACVPNGMMSVTPFNVMGGDSLNRYDKDRQWWSTPFCSDNRYCTGFSHVNLSGVGCPDMSSFLLMATEGELQPDYRQYGSTLSETVATPGYLATTLDKYQIRSEFTVTERTALARFSYRRKGRANILLNLGEGLTNESGATIHFINDSTLVGSKLMGTFCYNPQAVFRQYFAMRLSKRPITHGYWKKQRPMAAEAAWESDQGKYKIYDRYTGEMSGDDIGVWLSYKVEAGDNLFVQTAVSFVSEAGALTNLQAEQTATQPNDTIFHTLRRQSRELWEQALGVVEVEGGTEEQRIVFYTALYHLLIHPNLLNDAGGEYPQMESLHIGRTDHPRYTVFSLWDTYRNVHPLLSLLYPQKQIDMVCSIMEMYREGGWLPRWELFGRETLTMGGDPAIIVLNDTYSRGLPIPCPASEILQAMRKGADTPGTQNLLRPDNDDYLKKGFIPLREKNDNSVSNALEYYLADWNLAQFAQSQGLPQPAAEYTHRAMQYKRYYSSRSGTLCPLLPNGTFLYPFDPKQGQNFDPTPGFHEGSAWSYTFFVPHDIPGLIKLMGGTKPFVSKLQHVFDSGLYDPANEPDIAYPYLFTYIPSEAWRTQKLTAGLLDKYFRNAPDGLPGNDDAGTMSAWAIFSMMGFYPDCPGQPEYALTCPIFPKITLHLDSRYYPKRTLIIRNKVKPGHHMRGYTTSSNGKTYRQRYRISHQELVNAQEITFL